MAMRKIYFQKKLFKNFNNTQVNLSGIFLVVFLLCLIPLVAYALTSITDGENSLFIWDDTDGALYNAYEQVNFHANFSNSTGPINATNDYCNISFSSVVTGPYSNNISMIYNASSDLYDYNRTFNETGQYFYNVTCYKNGVHNLSLTDAIDVNYQSRAYNKLSTNISAYILMQIDYWNSSSWVLEDIVVNSVKTRINSTTNLKLDSLFNGNWNTDNATNGDGTYRVYVAVVSSNGTVLKNKDNSDMVASYNFTFSIAEDNLPIVQLNYPENNHNTTQPQITFNCTATDDLNLANVTLYGSWNNWHANETNSTPVNNTPILFTKTIPEGTYEWNCYACDNASNCTFATNNRTFTIDSVIPISDTPADSNYTQSTSATINWTLTDNQGEGYYYITRNETTQNQSTPWVNDTEINVWVNTSTIGVYNYTIHFNDSFGNENTDEVIITITATNTAPIIIANATSPVTVYTNTDFKVNLTITDPDANILTGYVQFYVNNTSSGPVYLTSLVTNDTNTLMATLGSGNFTKNSNLTAEVWAGDGTENTTKANLTQITVQNSAPVITTTPTAVSRDANGTTWNYDYNATDVDQDSLTWYDNASLFTINSSTGLINDTPAESEAGTYSILINVSDGTAQNTDAFTYIINDVTLPIYSNNQDDSGGSVTEGTIVNLSVYWQDINLQTAEVYHNATNSFMLNSTCSLTPTADWCNRTINTTGMAGKTICWKQYANDTGGNKNITMQNNSHCFTVTTQSSTSFSVILNSPQNQSYTNNNSADFNFTVSGTEVDYNCTLYIDGASGGTNYSVQNNTPTIITSANSDGTYDGYVNCTSNSVTNQSEIRTLTVDSQSPYYWNVSDACNIDEIRVYSDATIYASLDIVLNGSLNGDLTLRNTTLYANKVLVENGAVLKIENSKDTIILNDNLNVSGTMYLNSSTCKFNGSSNGQIGIDVVSTGTFYIFDNSNITNGASVSGGNATAHYFFRVQSGATFHMNDSTLTECGFYGDDDLKGLYIKTDNTYIINNTFRENYMGLYFDGSDNNTVYGNELLDNNGTGMYLSDSNGNNITGNTVNGNGDRGILLLQNSNHNILENNIANSNYNGGLNSIGSSYNVFRNNTANLNGGYGGISFFRIFGDSKNNTIINNNVNSNSGAGGIFIQDSIDNNITGNNINLNTFGIYINSSALFGSSYSSTGNTIVNNNIIGNNDTGIYLNSVGDGMSTNNAIYNNFFNNTNNTNFNGIIYVNFWNTTNTSKTNIVGGAYMGGNYWAYPNGTGFSETCNDTNNDGFCDNQYNLTDDGNNIDYLPLSINNAPLNNTPSYSSFNGSTTNFSQYNSTEIQNVSNAVLEILLQGSINFLESANFSNADLDSYVFIEHNKIGIDTINLPHLNKSANITFYNVSFTTPILRRNGIICSAPNCTLISNNRTQITYNVSHFSNYTINECNSTVTRILSSSVISPGKILTVTLNVTINGNETNYLIDEIIPPNFTIVDNGTGNTSDEGHIKWAIIENATTTQYNYTLTSSVSGNYTFNGTHMFEGMSNETTTLGNNSVRVRNITIVSDKTTYKCYPICTAYVNVTHAENVMEGVYTVILNNSVTKSGIDIGQEYYNASGWHQATANHANINNYNFSQSTHHQYKFTINLSEPKSAKWNFSVTVNGITIVLDPYIDSINLTNPVNSTFVTTTTDFNFTLFAQNDTNQSCTLWLNDTAYGQTYAINGTPATINLNSTPANGIYTWNVSCTNYLNETGYSEARIATIDTILPVFSNYQRVPNQPNEDLDAQVNVTITETNLDAVIFEWNGTTNYTVTTSNGNEYYFTINQGNYTAHDQVTYYWYANDSAGNLNRSAQQSFIVANQVSSISDVSISPAYPRDSDDLICSVSGWSDPDAEDTAGYYYNWYKNEYLNRTIYSTQATNTLTSGNTTDGDVWNCTVIPNDGYENGTELSDYATVSQYGPPSVTLNLPVNNYNSSNATITFNCSAIDGDQLANLTLYGNWSGGWHANETNSITGTSNSTTFTKTLTEGIYEWNCRGCDNISNCSFAVSNYTFTIDTTSPTVDLDEPADNGWSSSNTISFKYTPSDIYLDTCVLYHNASGWNSIQTNNSVTSGVQSEFSVNLGDGDYIWNILCNDTAGNSAFNATNYTLHVDATSPVVTYLGAESNNTYFNRNWVYVNVSVVEDNFKNITFYLHNTSGSVNTTTFTDTTRNINWTNLPANERYYYNITVYDNAENSGSTQTRRITLDSENPAANITSPANETNTTDPTPLIKFNLSDNLAETLNYTVFVNGTSNGQQGQVYNNIENNLSLNDLALGDYFVTMQAMDQAKNTANSTDLHITILPPAVYLSYPEDNYFTTETNINFTFNVSDPECDSINCSLYIDNIYNQSNTSTKNYTATTFVVTGLTEGNNHEWRVYCINSNNNTGNNIKIFNIDLTRPTIDFSAETEPNNSYSSETWIYINVSAHDLNEANMTFNLYNSSLDKINTTILASGNRNINFTNLVDGIYYYNATIEDLVNYKNSTQTRKITLDNVVPTWSGNKTNFNSTIEYSVDKVYQFNITWNDTYLNTVVIEHNFTGVLANYTASSANNESYYNTSGIVAGSYIYSWYANDSAGNTNKTDSWTFTINSDIIPPNVTLISPSNTSTWSSSSTVTFTYNVSDEGNVTNCSLLINGAVDQIDTTITRDESQIFTKSMSNSDYNWSVTCYDGANQGNSSVYYLTVGYTAPDDDNNNGGGGGGGGSVTSDKIIVTNKEPITRIEINLNQRVSSPSLKVEQLTTPPIPKPNGIIYKYFNLTKTNFNNSIIKNATIEFNVNGSWIINNNILNVFMVKYENGWVKLKTEITDQTANQVHYKSPVDGFSYFAIIGETELPVCNEGETRCSGNNLESCLNNEWTTIETCEHGCNSTSLTCNPESSGETLNYLIYLFLMAIAIIAGVIIYLKRDEIKDKINQLKTRINEESRIKREINGIKTNQSKPILSEPVAGKIPEQTVKPEIKSKVPQNEEIEKHLDKIEKIINNMKLQGKDTIELERELNQARADLELGLIVIAEERIKELLEKLW